MGITKYKEMEKDIEIRKGGPSYGTWTGNLTLSSSHETETVARQLAGTASSKSVTGVETSVPAAPIANYTGQARLVESNGEQWPEK